jgi:hypothetical protein
MEVAGDPRPFVFTGRDEASREVPQRHLGPAAIPALDEQPGDQYCLQQHHTKRDDDGSLVALPRRGLPKPDDCTRRQ